MVLELIVAVATAAITMAVFIAGDRMRPKSWQHTSEESAWSLALDLIKTFFTAVVAFVVVICWQQYQNAHDGTVTEANGLIAVYSAAHALPEPDRTKVRTLVRDYTSQVVNQEWPTMDRDRELSSAAQDTLDSLHETVQAVPGEDQRSSDLRSSTLADLDQVSEARNGRALAAAHGIPGFLWVLLWFGTVLLLLSPVLSGVKVSRRSVIMMGLLGVVVGSAVVLIYQLDYPFSGGEVVPKDAFEHALSLFRQTT